MNFQRITIAATIVLIMSINFSIHAQKISPLDILHNYNEKHFVEKAYLHFDKPYYAAGDTIYFKAYVTAGEKHQLSNLSGVLRVDLINTNNKIDKSIKLQLVNGVGWGDFTLPDSLSKGDYRVRAYTQWMRNERNYFERTFPVGSLRVNKIPEGSQVKQLTAKPDLQFFPEGGENVQFQYRHFAIFIYLMSRL